MYKTEKNLLDSIISRFENALSDGREETIHQFLTENSFLLRFVSGTGILKSKFRLADAFVPDFLAISQDDHASNTAAPLLTFVEIERADKALFTRSGDPSSFLMHAIRQVQDWKHWVNDNRGYLQHQLRRLLSEEFAVTPLEISEMDKYFREPLDHGINYGFLDRYVVIAGRRASMTVSQRLRLAQMNNDLNGIQIISYDALVEDVLNLRRYYDRLLEELE